MLLQIKTYLLNNKITVVLAIITLIAVTSATWNWYHPQIRTVSKTEYQTVTQEKVVEKIKRISVPGPERIVTIEKQVIVEKLGINPVPGDDEEVIANAEIECPDNGAATSVVAVIDMPTGITTIIAKEKPLSLLGFPSNKEVMLRYGLSTRGVQEANLAARWQFFRIGGFVLGAYGEVSSMPEAKAMLEVAYKF